MIELVSTKTILSQPRYIGGAYLSTRLDWQRDETVALQALCLRGASLEKSAEGLGRSPTSIAHRARDTGLKLPYEWRDAITTYKRRTSKGPLLQYPYIQEVRGEHSDLLAVNGLVPANLPEHIRADVCQEIMLQMFLGEITLDELRNGPGLVRKFINQYRKQNCEAGGYAISLDAPMVDGRSWYDVLPDPDTLEWN